MPAATLLPILLWPLLPADAPPALSPAPAAYRKGFDSVSLLQLRAWIELLASPELEGREAGTRGYDVASRFAASVLEEAGIAPFGDAGTYFQEMEIVQRSHDYESATLELKSAGSEETIHLTGEISVEAEDFRPIDWSAPWALAGPGSGAAFDGPDDFRGASPADHVIVVVARPGRWMQAERAARVAGGRRIVIVSDERTKGRKAQPPQEAPANGLKPLPGPDRPQVVWLSRAAADRLLARKGTSTAKVLDGSSRQWPMLLDDVTVRLRLDVSEHRRKTRNVVGFLEGSDPALKGEYVAIGAHLDHVGIQGGKLFPGADDDASGTAAVLAVAKAFAANDTRPRRSIAFMLFTAEEKGLWGSGYFVEKPPVPLEKIVLEIQLDMVGRNEESRSNDPKKAEKAEDNVRTLHVVGSKRRSLELDPWIHALNAHTGLGFEYDQEDVYTRSDQWSFASRGVPVVFFFAGFHPDYHQPSDTPEKINYEKVSLVARLVFGLAFEVADREKRLAIHRL